MMKVHDGRAVSGYAVAVIAFAGLTGLSGQLSATAKPKAISAASTKAAASIKMSCMSVAGVRAAPARYWGDGISLILPSDEYLFTVDG